jgi:hypothetical protein
MAVQAVCRELVSAISSLIYREDTGKFPIPDSPAGTRAEIRKTFRGLSDRFPVIRSREFGSASREILAADTGLQAAAIEPNHPSPI